MQRILSQAARGIISGRKIVDNVKIEVISTSTPVPAPKASFEDVKAFCSAGAANASGFRIPEEVFVGATNQLRCNPAAGQHGTALSVTREYTDAPTLSRVLRVLLYRKDMNHA